MNKTSRFPLRVAVCLALGLGLASGPGGILFPASRGQGPGPDARLGRVLRLTKDYCRRLERAALDFVCVERIKEEIFPLPEVRPDAMIADTSGLTFSYRTPRRRVVRTFVYDYQFLRKAGQSVENRTLIEENGRARKEKDALLQTLSVRVENALFGPVGLLSADRQSRHDYTIAGEESARGKRVLLVDAVPRPPLEPDHVVGRVWILEEDASILKVEWNQTSVGNFQFIEERARELKGEPRLVSTTEYGVSKNGIRFPSRDTTEEAYILKNGKTFTRSTTTILYDKYRFFTVETEVEFRR